MNYNNYSCSLKERQKIRAYPKFPVSCVFLIPSSNPTSKSIKMCRVQTERFHALCGHYSWLTTQEENGPCGACEKHHAYRLETWHELICPSCWGSDPLLSHAAPPEQDRLKKAIEGSSGEDREVLLEYKRSLSSRYCEDLEAEKEQFTFHSRETKYDAALVLYQRARVAYTLRNARTGLRSSKLDPELVGISVERVPPRSLPLHFEPNPYLIDNNEFASPVIYVVPPGAIPQDMEKCGVCWGLFGVSGEDACEGGFPRRLPCGHIYGRECISKTFRKWDICPYCTRTYKVRRRRYPGSLTPGYDAAAIYDPIEHPMLEPGWVHGWSFVMWALVPFVVAVVLTMDVGPRVEAGNEGGYHIFRGSNRFTKLFVVLACIALSPAIYGYGLRMWWTGELAEIGR
jgi:hypothetical protein